MVQERVENFQMPKKSAEEMLNMMLRICTNTMMVYNPTSLNGVVGVGGRGMAGGLSLLMCPYTDFKKKRHTTNPA